MQSDRQDKSAVGWDHQEKVEDHQSQKDYKTGFGGQYGVLSDRQDKSAVGWDHVEQVEKHQSQKGKVLYLCFHKARLLMINPPDYKSGFGGSYGVQADRMDSSALGWDHYESPERHPSQKGNLYLWVWFVWYNGNGSDKLSKQRKWLTDGTHDRWVLTN